jgi:transposase InsO family protein
MVLIGEIFAMCNKPGVRRVRAALEALGHKVSHNRVYRLMKRLRLQGRHPRAYKKTTRPGKKLVDAPDLVKRKFTADGPNQKWCGDVTYIKTWDDGWAYMATVIDLYSRKLVGWAISDRNDTPLIVAALKNAIANRKPKGKVIFHSDRGSNYTSEDFAKYCKRNNVTRSLGRTGSCFDNAVSESFNATYKKELIHTRPWPNIQTVKRATFDWVETHYNRTRRHSTLGYLTIEEYELGYRKLSEITT